MQLLPLYLVITLALAKPLELPAVASIADSEQAQLSSATQVTPAVLHLARSRRDNRKIYVVGDPCKIKEEHDGKVNRRDCEQWEFNLDVNNEGA